VGVDELLEPPQAVNSDKTNKITTYWNLTMSISFTKIKVQITTTIAAKQFIKLLKCSTLLGSLHGDYKI
jgi:hypothetical protein